MDQTPPCGSSTCLRPLPRKSPLRTLIVLEVTRPVAAGTAKPSGVARAIHHDSELLPEFTG